MNFSDYLKYTYLKVWRDKRNVFLFIILVVGSTTLLCSLYYRNFKSYNTKISMQTDIRFRQVYFFPTEEDKEKYEYPFNNDNNPVINIENVLETYSMDYNINYIENVTIDGITYEGFLGFIYGSKNTLPKNIIGETFSENATGVAICPINMFLTKNDGETTHIPNSENLIGTYFSISQDIITYDANNETFIRTGEKYDKTYRIIGIYDNAKNGNIGDECFISPNDIAELKEEISGHASDLESSAMIALVDDVKNVNFVLSKLSGKNYSTGVVTIVLWDYIYKILNICDIIAFVASYAILTIILFFYKKKSIKSVVTIGEYKALGLKNREIKIINLLENIILMIISFLMSCSFLELFIFGVKHYFSVKSPTETLFYPKFLSIYLISIIIIIIMPLLISNALLKKQLKKNATALLGDK